ncbi:hypothetical protein LSTR_LSTR013975 [Laodelphax striatellus]|uniref:Uncharacterized protein n=1 Tax=Laodelphax striatellus TaxID=195883 RepID=A0A482XII8_LAOST|nr:hypothetical protein LSTR_LSTR013975 [Laodelphax striatellus]
MKLLIHAISAVNCCSNNVLPAPLLKLHTYSVTSFFGRLFCCRCCGGGGGGGERTKVWVDRKKGRRGKESPNRRGRPKRKKKKRSIWVTGYDLPSDLLTERQRDLDEKIICCPRPVLSNTHPACFISMHSSNQKSSALFILSTRCRVP